MSRQTGDMEATSTVRTQASDTVDIIRETPDRSASYTNVLKRRMRWVDIDAAMSHQEEEEDRIRTSQAVSCTTEPFIARIARCVRAAYRRTYEQASQRHLLRHATT